MRPELEAAHVRQCLIAGGRGVQHRLAAARRSTVLHGGRRRRRTPSRSGSRRALRPCNNSSRARTPRRGTITSVGAGNARAAGVFAALFAGAVALRARRAVAAVARGQRAQLFHLARAPAFARREQRPRTGRRARRPRPTCAPPPSCSPCELPRSSEKVVIRPMVRSAAVAPRAPTQLFRDLSVRIFRTCEVFTHFLSRDVGLKVRRCASSG